MKNLRPSPALFVLSWPSVSWLLVTVLTSVLMFFPSSGLADLPENADSSQNTQELEPAEPATGRVTRSNRARAGRGVRTVRSVRPATSQEKSSETTAPTSSQAAEESHGAEGREMLVRVTVYWQDGAGTDQWTAQGKSSTGRPLQDRRSAAVDPAIIPYFSRILLPEAGKELVAVDTGSAVKARRAARAQGQDVPVVDVFFRNRTEALSWAKSNPMFMTAIIYDVAEQQSR
ncbi:MAG: hypothetical protein ACFCU3_04630 [Verrucomicrobiales bacterium]